MTEECIRRADIMQQLTAADMQKKLRSGSGEDAYAAFLKMVFDAPAADVVEVVRCKDCKYWMGQAYAYRCKRHSYLDYQTYTQPDAFCSFAKRRDNGDK